MQIVIIGVMNLLISYREVLQWLKPTSVLSVAGFIRSCAVPVAECLFVFVCKNNNFWRALRGSPT